MKYIFGLLSFLWLTQTATASFHVPDSTGIEILMGVEDDEQKDITDDLDKLLQSWYIKNYVSISDDPQDNSVYQPVVLNDSVLAAQLGKIASPFSMDYNEQVRDFINLYVNKRRKQVGYMLGLSEYYFPMFESVFDKHQIPLELKYLSIIESALNPRAVSPVGASGLWQFMYATGKIYKLEVNSFVDDRRDPLKSTEAAAQFLSSLYSIYKDWTLVIAAYNCGPGNVNKAIKRSGGKTNFWDIYNYLPKETRGYVPAFIAATYAFHYYDQYYIRPKKMNLPIMSDTMQIDAQLHFEQVASMINMPVEQLRELNPQYKLDIIPGSPEKPYTLIIPHEYSLAYIEKKDTIFCHLDSVYFAERRVYVPGSTSVASNVQSSNTNDLSPITYIIKSGDNLGLIAGWYDVTISNLKDWNNIHKLSKGRS